jgi:hypothetical protein
MLQTSNENAIKKKQIDALPRTKYGNEELRILIFTGIQNFFL